jgi:threonyl-tRNA synthetase
MAAPGPHPVESSATGQNPAQSLTDGVEQISINENKAENGKQASKKEKKAKGDKKGADEDGSKAPLEFTPTPAFFSERMSLFDKLKREQDDEREKKERKEVEVTLPDGKKRKAVAWQTSPMDIAKEISKSLSERIIISKVRGIENGCLVTCAHH